LNGITIAYIIALRNNIKANKRMMIKIRRSRGTDMYTASKIHMPPSTSFEMENETTENLVPETGEE